jgi:pimeloyl-ACP methyl ester carboxylesterase
MPFVRRQGIRIHYQAVGKGPPFVLHHGFTGSGKSFRMLGYTESLWDDYRLILIDARGHGGSDKPHRPESYKLELLVGDVVAVLDELNVSQAHFYGYSFGGRIGFAMAKFAPGRLHSLIIGGAHPYEEGYDSFRKVDGKDPEGFIAALEEAIGERLSSEFKTLVLANDLRALAASAQPRRSLAEVLPHMKMPCLVFAGTADSRYTMVKECVKSMPNARFFSLPGLNHVQAFLRVDLLLPRVKDFLEKDLFPGGTNHNVTP